MRRLLLIVPSMTLLLGCGGASAKDPTTPPSPVTSVTSLAVTASVVANGFQCVATAALSNGTTKVVTGEATWASSDLATATVSASGLVTAVKTGDVDVRATYQGVSGTLRLSATVAAAPLQLITPFVSQADMGAIREAFSQGSGAPWGFQHNGIDFFPVGDLKPFRAAAAGTVQDVSLSQNNVTSNWQVNVTIRYDATWSLFYAFEVFSTSRAEGDAQLAAMTVTRGAAVAQGATLGVLRALRPDAHVHFGLQQNNVAVCPDSYFTAQARQSVLELVRMQFPGGNLCY